MVTVKRCKGLEIFANKYILIRGDADRNGGWRKVSTFRNTVLIPKNLSFAGGAAKGRRFIAQKKNQPGPCSEVLCRTSASRAVVRGGVREAAKVVCEEESGNLSGQ